MRMNVDEIDVRRLRLEEGDVVVVTFDHEITEAQMLHAREMVGAAVEPHMVIVLGRGVTLDVIEPDGH